MNLYPVILCGGSGTRLWPLSRDGAPKQFLPILHGQSPFAATLKRVGGLTTLPPVIVTNQEHAFTVRAQLREAGIPDFEILLEPFGRNTAPAVAIAACQLLKNDPEAAMLVLPADHDIPDHAAFRQAVERGAVALAERQLVVFGLAAVRPETGYGYIERGDELAGTDACYRVARFIEKPEIEIARNLITSGRHHWNSGIFLFGAAHFLDELERLEPALAQACRTAAGGLIMDHGNLRIDAQAFRNCGSVSVDHAVLEKTNAATMVAADFQWSDIGSWDALWSCTDKDAQGNVAHGDVHLHDVSGSYIHSSRRMVVGVGLRNLVIIETADALLVATRENTQHVKEAVEQLRSEARDECRTHRRVDRPWGFYEDVDAGERFRVKRITVNPGAQLSLQMHHHRAEHWVVVRGTARVTRGSEVTLLFENESTYIPIGVTHRLENPGKIPLEVIETQSGAYLKEDDIVRLQDVYERA